VRIKPIGRVRRLSDEESVLEIDAAYRRGLDGVEAGDRLEVFYWMHRLAAKDRERLRVHPRGDKSSPLRGVFALRSPVRPNPIGATVVEVRRIRGTRLWVTGLDALDGSPIIDIKAARKTEGRKMPGGRGQADLPGREPRSAR
jgi:tRNA-Thr(GGU) m(6)t(6)A37 methyltransferase TsaA